MVKGRMRDSLRQLIARCTPHQQDSSGTQTQTSSSAAPSVSVVPGAADLHPDTETDAPHSSSTEQLETIISAPGYSVDTNADDATRTDSLALPSQPTASMTAPGNVARWWRENEVQGACILSNTQPQPLWIQAFNQLSVAEREILEPSLPHPDYNDTTVALERIRTRIQDAMAAKRDRTWRIKWRGEDIVLHDVGMKIVNWIDKFKQIGDIAVQYDPGHAALPWAAFRFLLEVVSLTPSDETEVH